VYGRESRQADWKENIHTHTRVSIRVYRALGLDNYRSKMRSEVFRWWQSSEDTWRKHYPFTCYQTSLTCKPTPLTHRIIMEIVVWNLMYMKAGHEKIKAKIVMRHFAKCPYNSAVIQRKATSICHRLPQPLHSDTLVTLTISSLVHASSHASVRHSSTPCTAWLTRIARSWYATSLDTSSPLLLYLCLRIRCSLAAYVAMATHAMVIGRLLNNVYRGLRLTKERRK